MNKVLFHISPVVSYYVDTSIYLMREAINRGFTVYFTYPENVFYSVDGVKSKNYSFTLDDDGIVIKSEHYDYIDNHDMVFIRHDPPVDMSYQTSLYLFGLCTRAFFINNPQAILLSPEKIFKYHLYSDLETIIVCDVETATKFVEQYGKVVFKPLYEYGGSNIILIDKSDANYKDILSEKFNNHGTHFLMQRFDSDVLTDGDVRVLILDGEILGYFKRQNKDNFLSNTVLGAKVYKVDLSNKALDTATKIALDLKQRGIYFAGLDFIGNNLIEINVTSPTGLVHYDMLRDKSLDVKCWDKFIRLYEDFKKN
ncbi:hypothetical protein GUI12_00580 [Anaplasmataceae bacterium AB001_6]|nr:hypothetical protein GUI12_00580 [Anaplasmataceae bacterium AB001_6]